MTALPLSGCPQLHAVSGKESPDLACDSHLGLATLAFETEFLSVTFQVHVEGCSHDIHPG